MKQLQNAATSPSEVYVRYHYLGLGQPVVVDYDVPDMQLDYTASPNGQRNWNTYTGNAGVYPGLDRFGRVIRQMWVDGVFDVGTGGNPDRPPIVSLQHGYDRASNRTTRYDVRPGAVTMPSYQYEYDGLHRLKEAKRGTWDGASTFTPGIGGVGGQKWQLDQLGNWLKNWMDGNANGSYSDGDELDERAHNGVNELSQRILYGQATGPGDLTLDLAYDKAGNLRTEDRPDGAGASYESTYTHDAWNRLVKIVAGSDDRAEYQYNGLNWRIVKKADTSVPADGDYDEIRVMYYAASWQLLESHIDDNDDTTVDRHRQYVWGARYIDDIVMQRENNNFGNDTPDVTYELTYLHLTDAQFSTVALMSGATVIERITYDAYGQARRHRPADLNGDGVVGPADQGILLGNWGTAPSSARPAAWTGASAPQTANCATYATSPLSPVFHRA